MDTLSGLRACLSGYILPIFAFLDVLAVGVWLYKERGPGGSLEYQLCPGYNLPSNEPDAPV